MIRNLRALRQVTGILVPLAAGMIALNLGLNTRHKKASNVPPSRHINNSDTFGDWGNIGDGPALSNPEMVTIVPITHTSYPNQFYVRQEICVSDNGYVVSYDRHSDGTVSPGTRFHNQATGQPLTSDPAGDICYCVAGGIQVGHFDDTPFGQVIFSTDRVIPIVGAVTTLTADGHRNVYIASGNQIYKANVKQNSPPTNLQIRGLSTITGLAVATDGSLYVAAGQVYKFVNGAGGYIQDTSFSTEHMPLTPVCLAVDNTLHGDGSLYVTDEIHDRITQFDTYGNYVADLNNIAIVDPSVGILPGGGLGQTNHSAGVLHPRGLNFGPDGTLWVVEYGRDPNPHEYDNRIVAFSP